MLLLCLLVYSAQAFVVSQTPYHYATSKLFSTAEPQLAQLDHAELDQIGTEMAGSVQRWLDHEWMPQHIHAQMGESAKQTFITYCSNTVDSNESNIDIISTILIQVANDLNANWQQQYDKDAFVNAWDVANYVSDYLIHSLGIKGCECSAKIH